MTEEIKKAEVPAKESVVPKAEQPTSKMRQIVIETDGNSVNLVKAEVNGRIELVGVLQSLIGYLNQPK